MGGKDMVSASAFYKHFQGHIELVSFDLAPDNLKPRNSGTAHVVGGEFEVRKGLKAHFVKIPSRLLLRNQLTLVRHG